MSAPLAVEAAPIKVRSTTQQEQPVVAIAFERLHRHHQQVLGVAVRPAPTQAIMACMSLKAA